MRQISNYSERIYTWIKIIICRFFIVCILNVRKPQKRLFCWVPGIFCTDMEKKLYIFSSVSLLRCAQFSISRHEEGLRGNKFRSVDKTVFLLLQTYVQGKVIYFTSRQKSCAVLNLPFCCTTQPYLVIILLQLYCQGEIESCHLFRGFIILAGSSKYFTDN